MTAQRIFSALLIPYLTVYRNLWIKSGKRELISKVIDGDEPCARAVFHPVMYKKNGQLKHTAILPQAGKHDVSLYRLRYASVEFCVNHAKKNIKRVGSKFRELAQFTSNDLDSLNEVHQGVNAHIAYSPMNKGEYISKDIDVFVNDPLYDLPVHADLIYNISPEKGIPNPNLNKYAYDLIKRWKTVYEEP